MLNRLLQKTRGGSKNQSDGSSHSLARGYSLSLSSSLAAVPLQVSQYVQSHQTSQQLPSNLTTSQSTESATGNNKTSVKVASQIQACTIIRQQSPQTTNQACKMNSRNQMSSSLKSQSSVRHSTENQYPELLVTPSTKQGNMKSRTDLQGSSIQRVAVNLNSLVEFTDDSKRQITSRGRLEVESLAKQVNKKQTEGVSPLKITEKLFDFAASKDTSNVKNRNEKEDKLSKNQRKQDHYERNYSIQATSELFQDDIAFLRQENKNLKNQVNDYKEESLIWRKNCDKLERKHMLEIEQLNNQLEDKHLKQQSGAVGKKKIVISPSTIVMSKMNGSIYSAQLSKRETTTSSYSSDVNTASDQLHTSEIDTKHNSYLDLKDRSEKIEKTLKKRIQSLEEQVAFMQTELNSFVALNASKTLENSLLNSEWETSDRKEHFNENFIQKPSCNSLASPKKKAESGTSSSSHSNVLRLTHLNSYFSQNIF